MIYERGWRVGKRVCRKDDETRVGTITYVEVPRLEQVLVVEAAFKRSRVLRRALGGDVIPVTVALLA